jgi:imidazolonepropionase-like amidohydrolase
MLPFLLAAALVADSTRYVVWNHGREAGDMNVVRVGDTITVRYEHLDRNRGVASAHSYRVDRLGRVLYGESRAWTFGGEIGAPNDRFEVVRDSLVSGVTATPTRYVMEKDMVPRLRASITAYDQALLAKWLLAQPGGKGRSMPGAVPMQAEVIGRLPVRVRSATRNLKLVALYQATNYTPVTIWLDEKNDLFAGGVEWFIPVIQGGEAAMPALRDIELKWRNAQGLALAKKLPRPAMTTIISNGDVFDSERGIILPKATVVIRDDRIVSVGDTTMIREDARGVRRIDATGMTVIPGMWDMHGHLQQTSQTAGGILQLSFGLTTVRDLAADIDVATWYRDQANTGAVLGSRAVLAGFIEGPLKWAGPSASIASTEAEARAWVTRYDSLGYKQIKLYNVVHPDLVPTIAAEAHRRGMRLSGHVPRGLSTPAAIMLGFDEINHAAFLFSTFYPDSLYLPKMRAYSAVASAVAPNIDVNGPGFTSLIDVMRQHNTVLDGTYNIWTSTASAGVGAPPVDQKGIDNYLRTIMRLDSAGVVLVPGTDNTTGATYQSELESYVKAGLSPAKVLQMATIVSARVMKEDKDYGSIAAGKVADVVIMRGKPHERIADARNIEYVIRAGRVYTPAELRGVLSSRVATPR